MSKHHEIKAPAERFEDPFAEFFIEAEKTPAYLAELSKLEFTEKVTCRMKELGLKKGELARRMGVQPGFVTRLLSGRNNFELGTMVKMANALESDFRCHLQPHGTDTMWINVLKTEPERPLVKNWNPHNYKPLDTSKPINALHETVPAAA